MMMSGVLTLISSGMEKLVLNVLPLAELVPSTKITVPVAQCQTLIPLMEVLPKEPTIFHSNCTLMVPLNTRELPWTSTLADVLQELCLIQVA